METGLPGSKNKWANPQILEKGPNTGQMYRKNF